LYFAFRVSVSDVYVKGLAVPTYPVLSLQRTGAVMLERITE